MRNCTRFVRPMLDVDQSEVWLWSCIVFLVSIRPELVGFNFDVYTWVSMSDVFVGDPCFATWLYFVYMRDDCVNECRCVVSGEGNGIILLRCSNGWRRCSSIEPLSEYPADLWEHCSGAFSVGMCISE